jgi:hypothetical protein
MGRDRQIELMRRWRRGLAAVFVALAVIGRARCSFAGFFTILEEALLSRRLLAPSGCARLVRLEEVFRRELGCVSNVLFKNLDRA